MPGAKFQYEAGRPKHTGEEINRFPKAGSEIQLNFNPQVQCAVAI
jgi:hypothetical protein